jgi:large subunit ribosomal protein L30
MSAKLRLKWVRSQISCNERQRATLRGLGLRRMQQTVEIADTPAVRGMIDKVKHLVAIVEK